MRAIVVVLLLAGCADVDPVEPEPEPIHTVDLTNETLTVTDPALPMRANLTLDDGVTIRFEGTGWGRLAITTDGGSLPVRILHDEWDDLTLFSDDADDVYSDGLEHTFLFFGRPMDFRLDQSFTWQWWGAPGWGIWPSSNAWDEWDHTTLSYSKEDVLHLVVQTSVEGYSFQIGDGGEEVVWRLGEHPDFHLAWPDPSDNAIVDEAVVEVAREREWRLELADQPPSYLIARSYTRNDGAIEAGTEGEDLGWETGTQEGDLPLTPFPMYSVSGSSYSASSRMGVLEATTDIDLFRILETTKAKAQEKQEYGGFVAVPLV